MKLIGFFEHAAMADLYMHAHYPGKPYKVTPLGHGVKVHLV